MTRPIPFDLALNALDPAELTAVLEALQTDAIDLRDRDAVLLHRGAVSLLRDLRPDDGLGSAADEFIAFLHHALAWQAAGRVVGTVPPETLGVLVGTSAPDDACADDGPRYIQLPMRRLWGRLAEGDAHEPLDGLHLLPLADGTLRVLACFGVHEQRAGLTVSEVVGPRPGALARPDGAPLFAPQMPGGAAAGLHELIGADELLELGWRAALLIMER